MTQNTCKQSLFGLYMVSHRMAHCTKRALLSLCMQSVIQSIFGPKIWSETILKIRVPAPPYAQ